METFRKWNKEVIVIFNNNNWLGVNISKVGHGYSKRCINSCCLVGVISEQGEAFGRLNQTILNYAKGIKIISNTMGGMGQDLHNIEKGGILRK